MPKKKIRPNPTVGLEFKKVFKGKPYTLKVVKVDGQIGFKVGKSVFPSPTAAAKSITKNEINGWKFWAMD